MALYTSSYLKAVSANVSESRLFSERQKTHTSFDIFLSHSFLDKADVLGLYYELTQLGFSVYVDWIIDPQLDRNNVTKQSAEHIRNRMKASKTLLLAISTNAQMSRWMPWELGYVDGHTNKCAIVPVSKESMTLKNFERTEYLLLYPYIKRAAISYREEAFVTESANTYVSLTDWINRNASPVFNSKNIEEL